jgi:hypothetical protein
MSQAANWPVPPPGATAVGSLSSAPGTIFPSAAYGVGTTNSAEMDNPSAKGVRLFINTTVTAGGATVLVSIQTKDQISGSWSNTPDSATTISITSNVLTTLTVYPGIAETVPGTTVTEVSDHLGTPWRVVLVVGTATATLSVSGI